jgi:hypothetical protein
LPLNPGDRWAGLDTLKVVDNSTGDVLTEGNIVLDMDIDPKEGLITMIVSSDIG